MRSFGVTLWEILTRRRPWDGLDGLQVRCCFGPEGGGTGVQGLAADSPSCSLSIVHAPC